jgi:hypothetical protein
MLSRTLLPVESCDESAPTQLHREYARFSREVHATEGREYNDTILEYQNAFPPRMLIAPFLLRSVYEGSPRLVDEHVTEQAEPKRNTDQGGQVKTRHNDEVGPAWKSQAERLADVPTQVVNG